MMMFRGAFWCAAGERAIKTMAQAVLALIGTGTAGVTDLDWPQILSVATLAGIVSLLTSLASDKWTPGPGPGAFGREVLPTPGTKPSSGRRTAAPGEPPGLASRGIG